MSKTRRRFTRILLFSVSALGLLSATLLITDPPPPETDSATGLFAINTEALTSQRDLASTNRDISDRPSPDALMQIDCTGAPMTLKTASTRFRLKGPLCATPGGAVISAEVHNVSNGYVATVFHQAGQFTTDYINLNEGKNEINVKFNGDNGVIEKTITVLRSSPPAKIQD